ncbi:MAG TPA: flagellar basal body rod protein FlgB [Rhodocyclaceae bacterium]|nr:flagellar basal body rod protein FlgB [Rhodocyclaceae bacterium]
MKALIDEALRFHQTALNVQAQRQQLLASNIANADTPGFKARDLDFRAALEGALGARGGPLAMTTTSARHLPTAAAMPFDNHVGYRSETQANVDGNTVNMDVERAAFAENSVHYEASVTFISGLLNGMRTAISGQ